MRYTARLSRQAIYLSAATFILPLCARAVSPPRLPPDEQAVARLLAISGEGFRIRETDHFAIAYDTSYEALRPLVGRLEGTYDAIRRFCRASDLAVDPPVGGPKRFDVILFDKYEDFTRYSAGIGVPGGSMAGFYHHQTNIAVFCNTLNHPPLQQLTRQIERAQDQLKQLSSRRIGSRTARKQRQDLQRTISTLQSQREALVKKFNRFVIQHEVAHQMFFNLGVHVWGADNPFWLAEGLACQFEVPQAGHAGALKRINHMRLGDFREALGVTPDEKNVSEEAYREALESRRVVPLIDLIASPSAFEKHDDQIAFRYAQAWALVYYLYREHREPFVTYLRRLSNRRVGEVVGRQREIDEFQSLFGEPNAEFQRTWVAAMLKLRFDRREAGR